MGGGDKTTNTRTTNEKQSNIDNHKINTFNDINNYNENTSKTQYFKGNQNLGGLDSVSNNINTNMQVFELKLMNLQTGEIQPV